jgi:hypothetical protein
VADDRARTLRAVTVTTDDVARRAYELYLSRGAGDGQDVDDWLQAEQDLLVRSVRL